MVFLKEITIKKDLTKFATVKNACEEPPWSFWLRLSSDAFEVS